MTTQPDKSVGATLHPRLNDQGHSVILHKPSQPSSLAAWTDPAALACVIPGGPMPTEINQIAVKPWKDAPRTAADWEALAAHDAIDEPPFEGSKGLKKAAGVVVRETDGRVWLVAPSNAFGGYEATFPKGGLETKSTQATALAEAFEESGLRVRLIQHLIDVRRSTSYTRYYLAERIGGSPADMGWESQAVLLVPISRLGDVLNSPVDASICKKLASIL